MATTALTITKPDDFHHHFRDGEALEALVPLVACRFRRAIAMPNLKPPVTTTAQALAYRERLMAAVPAGVDFTPLMTLYLTDRTTAEEIHAARDSGAVYAVKLYPAGATTNSDSGVTDMQAIRPALEAMAEVGMPLLVHSEVTDAKVDIFDRESAFVVSVLGPLVRGNPGLKVVMEHITTSEGVDFVMACGPNVGATITPQHLMYNRNAIFQGGLQPHMYCLPVLKHERHRQALLRAIASGSPKFFLVKFNPCVQVVDVKKIQPNPGQSTGQDRYRLIISDGTHYQQAMLATQLNELVTSNQIVSYGLISLVDFICNEVQNKKIVIILKCEVVDASLGYKIGDPVEFGKAGAGGSGGGETVAAAPYQTKQEAPSLNTMAGASVPYKPAASSHGGGGVSGGGYQSNPYGGGGGGGYRAPAGPVVRAPINQSIIPIGDLNPYQNRWVIKARVTAKTDIKRWSNAKGEGTLFSIDMLDEGGGEMRATFFKEACEKFYPILEQGHVYTFSGGKLKVAQRQYSSIRNTYEATFDNAAEFHH
eukprot:evm.model.NODE_31173_length_31272_cov_26.593374.2